MPLCHQPVITFSCAAEDPAGWIIAEPQAAYKPRHPERTGFYQLFVDPLVCKCGARMRIISFITEPRVAGRVLRHRESERCQAKDPFEPRAPPSAHTRSRQ